MTEAVAITGVGVITPLGDTVASLMEALGSARSSVCPESTLAPLAASRLAGFEATRYANVRGMRIYNRTTRLGICATRLALVDAGLENAAVAPEQLGLVMASTYGHLDALIEYDRSLVTQGPSRTNPAWMPLAIPSAPGAMTALGFSAKAHSATLANEGVGALDALGLGARWIRDGRAQACVVVSALGLFDELLVSGSRAGFLASHDEFRVFDEHTRGTALGEAGAAVVLETQAHAEARGVRPRAFISGQRSTFATSRTQMGPSLARACRSALSAAGVTADALALISSGANGFPAVDQAEGWALSEVLGPSRGRIPITAIKSALGECLDTGGLLQTIIALAALSGTPAPPITRLQTPSTPGLRYLAAATKVEPSHALITATSRTRASSALVLSRGPDGV